MRTNWPPLDLEDIEICIWEGSHAIDEWIWQDKMSAAALKFKLLNLFPSRSSLLSLDKYFQDSG